jgi:mannosyltransferase
VRMATYASRPAWEVKARAVSRPRFAVPAGLGLLVLLSVVLRTREIGIGFWIDEGLSVGISDRPLGQIPGVLRQDGSPPLYYLLLHLWIRVFGSSEDATRWFSLTCALLAIPVAWWAARALFGGRAGVMAAILAATNPFLTQYAQEARMYSLVALVGLVACASWGRAFITDAEPGERRRWAAGLAVSLAALMYTHNWALFFAAACGGAWLVLLWRARGEQRGVLWRTGLVAFGGAIVLWLPWVPTVLYQSAHTGAPWAEAPSLSALLGVPGQLLGRASQAILALAGGAGVAALIARRHEHAGEATGARDAARARAAIALLLIGAATVLLAWLTSQASPAWAGRYLAIGLPPFLLAAAGGLAAAGPLGVAGLVLVSLLGVASNAPKEKSNVKLISQDIAPSLAPGDLVVATQPEEIPVLHYYLPGGLHYATITGPVRDLGVTDWRDGVQRLDAASARRDLAPLLDALPVGRRLALVEPDFTDVARWKAPWTESVRFHSSEWEQWLSNDLRFRVVSVDPMPSTDKGPNAVRATIYVKMRR